MIGDMGSNVIRVLTDALRMVRDSDGTVSALDGIGRAAADAPDGVRAMAIRLFGDAAVRPDVGLGPVFQEAILGNALRMAESVPGGTIGSVMSDGESMPGAVKAPKAQKKFNLNETFNTVATLGLKATDAGRKASCGYQFSRKTGKEGTMDLPAGTPVVYQGVQLVYEGQVSSKRMMFRVTAGTRVTLDGSDKLLDDDILVAGVVNHIDEDDPYNVQSRENEAKKAAKAQLRAAAAKTKAA